MALTNAHDLIQGQWESPLWNYMVWQCIKFLNENLWFHSKRRKESHLYTKKGNFLVHVVNMAKDNKESVTVMNTDEENSSYIAVSRSSQEMFFILKLKAFTMSAQ